MKIDFVRKHKIHNFSDILGQENVIRFLKNSLYKNHFFPLYIFSGMRGTGKTSTARIFSYAYFCQHYQEFCSSRQEIILPCGTCPICKNSFEGRNPNIIEIDAASNTGVDNIRALIENAYLLPVNSNKKFYIIDEAHMLSKSAFNACLKIMEEPPEHVHFIMATTEPHKIIDTIRSRSIHLHFTSIKHDDLVNYLISVAHTQNVLLEKDAAELLTIICEGSIRDSLNTLTKLYMIHGAHITHDIITKECFIISKIIIHNLADSIATGNQKTFYESMESIKTNHIDKKIFFDIFLDYILHKYYELVKQGISTTQYTNLIHLAYRDEALFLNAHYPYGILILWFSTLHQKLHHHDQNIKQENKKNLKQESNIQAKNNDDTPNIVVIHEQQNNMTSSAEKSSPENHQILNSIQEFIAHVSSQDKAIGAILSIAIPHFDSSSKTLKCTFDQNISFYKDFLEKKKNILVNAGKLVWNCDIIIVYEISTEPSVHHNRQKSSSTQHNIEKLSPKEEILTVPPKSSTVIPSEKITASTRPPYSNNYGNNGRYASQKKTVPTNFFSQNSLGGILIKSLPGVTYENNSIKLNNKEKK